MVLLFGTSTKESKLDFVQSIVCSNCGLHGKYEAFMTYSVFTIFFIPILKWNKRYYVTSTCCDSLYKVNKDIGRSIERGDNINIDKSDLQAININSSKVCANCKFPIENEFAYCPRCGEKIE